MFISLLFQFITLLNFFSNFYICFLLFIFGNLEIASESFVVLSLIAVFTQGFSGNIRNIYLGTERTLSIKKNIQLRILIGLIGTFLASSITYIFIGNLHILFHISLIFLTVTNWILELVIARFEKTNSFKIYYLVNLMFFFIVSSILTLFNYILSLSILIFLLSFLNILIFKKYILNVFNERFVLKKIVFSFEIFSTLFKTLTNFSWRYFMISILGKTEASFLFVGFSFGSFFGTLFDVSYGAFFLKKIRKKNIFINFFFTIYIIIFLLFIYFIKTLAFFKNEQFNILLLTAFFSICGGYLMVLSLKQRQLLFEKIKFRDVCYKADICIYFFNFFIIFVLYYFNKSFIITYFVSSLFCYFIYKIIIKNVYTKKII